MDQTSLSTGSPTAAPTSGRWRTRAGRLGLNAALAAIALGIGFLTGEVAVRVAAPQQLIIPRPDVWQPDDSLGWIHHRGVRTSVNTGERTVQMITDADGHRVGSQGRTGSRPRILIIGDSFLAAMQVEYEQSIPALLEADLRLRFPAASVVNAAVAGWGPSQYLVQASRSLHREPFDAVVVFVFLGNDIVSRRELRLGPLMPVEVHRLRFPRGLSRTELVQAVLYPVNDWLESRSHLFILAKSRLSTALMRLGLTARYLPAEVLKSRAGRFGWAVTADILGDLSAPAAVRRVPTLFVLLPATYQVDETHLEEYVRGFGIDPADIEIDQANRLLGQELARRALRVFDATAALRTAHHSGVQLYGSVDAHFTAAGHRVTEQAILPAVLTLLEGRSGSRSGRSLAPARR